MPRTSAAAPRAEDEVLVYEDQGSGAFINLACFGAYAEPTVAESLRGDATWYRSPGDKLLGGPQAGIVVGSKQLIDRLKKNPLARAMRLDKMTLAALEATLRLYLDPERALAAIPRSACFPSPTEPCASAERPGRRCAGPCPRAARASRWCPRWRGPAAGRCHAVRHPHVRGEHLLRARRRAGCEAFLVSKRACPSSVASSARPCWDARTIGEDDIAEIAEAVRAHFEGRALRRRRPG